MWKVQLEESWGKQVLEEVLWNKKENSSICMQTWFHRTITGNPCNDDLSKPPPSRMGGAPHAYYAQLPMGPSLRELGQVYACMHITSCEQHKCFLDSFSEKAPLL